MIAVSASLELNILAAPSLFLFLIILPLSNAIFDFTSLGATRLLLGRALETDGEKGDMLKIVDVIAFAIADVVIAAVLLFGLACLIVVLTHAVNVAYAANPASGGAPLIAIDEKLDALRDPSETGWWVYVMHFSTFIPSLIHLMIMLSSLPMFLFRGPQKLNEFFLGKIHPDLAGDNRHRALLALYLTARWVLPVLIAGFVFYAAFTIGAGTNERGAPHISVLGGWYLDRVEGFARLIGAVPPLTAPR